jgi:two-component system, OmpR family, phosphate regulon sensor histidine kinase PhoR
VSPISRRIFLYWLLLLVPTLVIGAAAIGLLRREQARLAARGAYADEARRAAVATRARLIAENVELLVGDVENGVLDILASEPAGEGDDFLQQLEKNNPLVRTVFRADAAGRILFPDARSASEDARGFLRRFARQFGNRPPWLAPAPAPAAGNFKETAALKDEAPARQEVSKNVAQVQSARRDVQELFKTQNAMNSAGLNRDRSSAAPAAGAPDSVAASTDLAAGKAAAPGSPPTAMRFARDSAARSGQAANRAPEQDRGGSPPAPAASVKEALPDRRGWAPGTVDGRLQLLGWVQPGGGGEVRGVELQLPALVSRLAAALPAELTGDEGYALRDDQGRVLHQVSAIPRQSIPAFRVPLAQTLLPGWEVVAYLPPLADETSGDGALLGLGVLLVAIFVAAILAGGSLLLWQARRSADEAVQKTSFVANVSHEFKTPLTTIRLYSELLEQGRVRDAAQGGEYLRTIGRETQRLARLVNNALDFSRLEQGRKKYARESLDLNAELRRLLETHAPRIAEAGLVLKSHVGAEPLPITSDRDAVEQIVLNLIDNACKYAAEGGEVAVTSAVRPAGGAEIRVSDRGPGVPAAHRERIFEKFHRVDDKLTAEKTGAGLGLSIARQLARGLGGELRYAPREGSGAEFILELR